MNGLGIFGGTSIRYKNPTYITDHGNRTLSWPEEWQSLEGCDIQDPETATTNDNRQGTLVQYTLYMPADTPVKDNAQIQYAGQELQVDGMILRIPDPLGMLQYAKATLKQWGG